MIIKSENKKFFAALLWIAAIFFCICFIRTRTNPDAVPAAEAGSIEINQSDTVRICFWNVKNYLDTYRTIDGKRLKAPKPESEKAEIVKILKEINPDILGVAEIGGISNLKEFSELLNAEGLSYPFGIISEDNAEYPQCAILSRIPIVSAGNIGKAPFDYFGEEKFSPRGLTLASFRFKGKDFLFGVLHLKSRFGSKKRDADFAKFRTLECEAISSDLKKYADIPGFIAGDFNDEPDDHAPKALAKNSGMTLVGLDKDSAKYSYVWTKENKSYLYDFFLANKAAMKLSPKACVLEINKDASDHAPVYIDIKRN